MAVIKILNQSADLSTANNCGNATFVRVVNTGAAEVTVIVANTVAPVNGGGISGSFVLEAGTSEIVFKEPTDTLLATADVKATPVARY